MISDTHNKHKVITNKLIGGDILIHSGDISSMGYEHEIEDFCKWFDSIDNYDTKIFIAGNHDWGFQNNVEKVMRIVNSYKTINYLQDENMGVQFGDNPLVNIYGTPWQPEFYSWAFNLPKNGPGLQSKWNAIPSTTDILVTHGPAYGFLDDVTGRRGQHLGCELLRDKVLEIKPKIHVCGHIHTGWGHYFDGHTHFFNASVLDERYAYTQTPWDIEWDPITNDVKF